MPELETSQLGKKRRMRKNTGVFFIRVGRKNSCVTEVDRGNSYRFTSWRLIGLVSKIALSDRLAMQSWPIRKGCPDNLGVAYL